MLLFDEFINVIHNLPSSSPYLPIILDDLNYHFNSFIYPHGDFKLLTEYLSLCQNISLSPSNSNTLYMICTLLSSHFIGCINPNFFENKLNF